MNIKKFLITESEKKDILKQYGILSEQATDNTQPSKTLEVDVRVTFKGGYYSETYADFKNTLDPELAKVTEFLKNGQGKAYMVSVMLGGGESRIPNTDNEKGGTRVEPGFLSKKRTATIQNYITKQLQSYVNQKLLLTLPSFKVVNPQGDVGGPKWIGQPFCPSNKIPADDKQGYVCLSKTFDPGNGIKNWFNGKQTDYATQLNEYINAQYLRVKLKLEELTTIKECLDNMVIEINYTDLSKGHKCNSSVYEITLNDVPLTRDDGKKYASLNNAKRKDGTPDPYDNNPGTCTGSGNTDKTCMRYNKFIVSPDLANKILSATIPNTKPGQTPKFRIGATCRNYNNESHHKWGNGCHEGAGDIKVTNGKGQIFNYQASTPTGKDQTAYMKDINACGKETK